VAATRAGTKTEKKSPIEIGIRTPKMTSFSTQSTVLPPISVLLEEEMRDIASSEILNPFSGTKKSPTGT
jgi:hypothetical protein